jgi:hypothetical protein
MGLGSPVVSTYHLIIKFLHYYFSCRIVSVQLIAHMFVSTYHLIIKFYLLKEKVYRYKMSWLLVVSTCSTCLCGQDWKTEHTIRIFFLRLLTVVV